MEIENGGAGGLEWMLDPAMWSGILHRLPRTRWRSVGKHGGMVECDTVRYGVVPVCGKEEHFEGHWWER
jgi:hypothetical protein